MKICNFYLLRHGKVEGEAALNGHTDRKIAPVLQLNWKNPAWHANLTIGNASLTHIQLTKAEQNYINVKSIAVGLC